MYNAKDYVETKNATPGTMVEGVIIDLKDGKAKDFLKTPEAVSKFKNADSPAINLVMEFLLDGGKSRIDRLFTYSEKDGKVNVKKTSNLGKYLAFYKKLPEVGDRVKLVSDAEGFFKLMI